MDSKQKQETHRDRKARQTRESILTAARMLFELDGFEGATMRRIAKAANIGVGTVFNYFPDKKALLYEALFADLEHSKAIALEQLPDDADGVLAQLEHIAMTFYGEYNKRPALSRTLLKEALFATDEWGTRFQAQVASVGVCVQGCIARAATRGELHPDTDAPLSTLSFFSHYYFILMWGINQPTPDIDQQRRRLRGLLTQWFHGAQHPPIQTKET